MILQGSRLFISCVVLAALWLAPGVLAGSFAPDKSRYAQPATSVSPDDRMAWWREARFGMFIHWGLYAVPAGDWNGKTCGGPSEWIMQSLKIPVSEYKKFAPEFNPTKYDPKAWARIAKDAGCKYVVITSRHHDGFCLWDSKVSEWDVMATPWKRDLLKPLAEACRAEGLRFGLYYSILDWRHPDYTPRRAWNDEPLPPDGARFDRFVEYVQAQVEEIITAYDPDILWFDGEWEDTWRTAHGESLEALCRKLKPDIIVNNRVGKARDDMAGLNKPGVKSLGDFCTPEQEVPSRGLPGVDWESCMTMNDSWGFKRSDRNWKASERLIHTLCEIAGKGGNFLLNVGPTAEGEIPPESIERLRAMGAWLKVYGASIYGTTAGPFRSTPWGAATQNGNSIYLHIFDGVQGAMIDVTALKSPFKAREMQKGSGVLTMKVDDQATGGPRRPDAKASAPVPDRTRLVLTRPPDGVHTPVIELRCEEPPRIVEPRPSLGADGSLTLPAIDAKLAPPAKVERLGGKPNIGFWTSPRATAVWEVELPTGRYAVELELSCTPEAAGNTFRVRVGADDRAAISGTVKSTGGWDRFETIRVGELTVDQGGRLEVTVSAVGTLTGGLMNLRSVKLSRVK